MPQDLELALGSLDGHGSDARVSTLVRMLAPSGVAVGGGGGLGGSASRISPGHRSFDIRRLSALSVAISGRSDARLAEVLTWTDIGAIGIVFSRGAD